MVARPSVLQYQESFNLQITGHTPDKPKLDAKIVSLFTILQARPPTAKFTLSVGIPDTVGTIKPSQERCQMSARDLANTITSGF